MGLTYQEYVTDKIEEESLPEDYAATLKTIVRENVRKAKEERKKVSSAIFFFLMTMKAKQEKLDFIEKVCLVHELLTRPDASRGEGRAQVHAHHQVLSEAQRARPLPSQGRRHALASKHGRAGS